MEFLDLAYESITMLPDGIDVLCILQAALLRKRYGWLASFA
jgi:hypothetical protein